MRHTLVHTLATFGCGDMHNLLRAVLAVCLLLRLLMVLLVVLVDCAVALRINAICLDIRTINSSTRVAASCCSQRVANPDHVWRRCPAHMTHTPRGSQLNAQRNYLTTWPIPITLTPPPPRCVPLHLPSLSLLGDKIRQKSFLIDALAGRKFSLAISSSSALSLARTNFFFKVTANK